MAPAADDALDGDQKSIFRCLDATRYVVAAAVTVLILAVIAYAIKVVLRPAELNLWVLDGSVSVKRSGNNVTKPYNFHVGGGDNLIFSLNLRTVNPSGRVSIYYTGIIGKLKGRNSSGAVNTIFSLFVDDLALGPQSTVDSNMLADVPVTKLYQEEYFKALANGTSIDDAWLMLNGTRTDEVYSGHNETGVPAVYYCSPITVGGDKDDDSTAALDALCMKNQPTTAS